ncbi:MAG TPA: hypothetical protein VLI54_04585 [Bacillota bacterium]|nr:hypothetical protein [Bacillota bacterium]
MRGESLPSGDDDSHNVDAAYADFLQRLQKREENRIPDALFTEYQDEVAFSILEQVRPCRLEDAPAAIENIWQTIPWGTAAAVRQVVAQAHGISSMYTRALLAGIDEPESAESTQVFDLLSGYVQELPDDPFSDPIGQIDWPQKIQLLTRAHELVSQMTYFDRRAFGIERLSPAMIAFRHILTNHVRHVSEGIRGQTNLSALDAIRIIDADKAIDEEHLRTYRDSHSKAKMLNRQRSIPGDLYALMDEARSDTNMSAGMELFYSQVEEPLLSILEEAQTKWTWTDVNQLLRAFPDMQSREMQIITIDALEDAGELDLADTPTGADLAADGLAALIHADIYNNMGPVSMPAHMIIDKGDQFEDITYENVTLPRGMVPAASVTLLGTFAEKASEEDFLSVLDRMQRTILSRPSVVATNVNEWLLTLALLRKYPNPRVREVTDRFIGQEGFPHAAFAHIVSGQKPGKIYLTLSGKIRVDTNLANGYELAASPYVETEAAPEAPKRTNEQRRAYSMPDKGVMAVPGRQTSKRRRQREAAAGRQSVPQTEEPDQRASPPIIVTTPPQITALSERLSPADRSIVAQAVAEYAQYGRHPLAPLRGRTRDGAMRCKMRLNGISTGIRVVLTHMGGNRYDIDAINYRGSVYKNLPR